MIPPFIDEDVAELEEQQQCREEGHKWVIAFCCRVCGANAEEAEAE